MKTNNHKCFEIAHGIRVIGDPNMSEKTKSALREMMRLARQTANGLQLTTKEFGSDPKSAKAENKPEGETFKFLRKSSE